MGNLLGFFGSLFATFFSNLLFNISERFAFSALIQCLSRRSWGCCCDGPAR
jgi:hypothetical protein